MHDIHCFLYRNYFLYINQMKMSFLLHLFPTHLKSEYHLYVGQSNILKLCNNLGIAISNYNCLL